MDPAAFLCATDEDIALRAPADFELLCPKDQAIARGADGVIDPGSPWVLASSTVDFLALGASPGQVAHLQSAGSGLRPSGECFVVADVAQGSITLRRKGQAGGVGMPPTTGAQRTGIAFAIVTYSPQIGLAVDDLYRRFGLARGPAWAAASCLSDPRQLRDAVVLTVLQRLYLDASREVSPPRDTFAAKAEAMKAELDDLLARLTLHVDAAYAADAKGPTTRFNTRMSR